MPLEISNVDDFCQIYGGCTLSQRPRPQGSFARPHTSLYRLAMIGALTCGLVATHAARTAPCTCSSMLLRRFASSASANRFALPPSIRQLLADPPQAQATTSVSGWIKSIRKQKNVSFAVLTDGSSTTGLQAVLVKGKEDDILKRSAQSHTYTKQIFLNTKQTHKWNLCSYHWPFRTVSGRWPKPRACRRPGRRN